MPLWLAYDHWTGLRIAENVIARQMAQASDSSLVVGTQPYLAKVADIMSTQSPELLHRVIEPVFFVAPSAGIIPCDSRPGGPGAG